MAARPGVGQEIEGQPHERTLTVAEVETIERQAKDRKAKVRPKMDIKFKDQSVEGQAGVARTIRVDTQLSDRDAAWRLLEASIGTSDTDFATLMMSHLVGISTRAESADHDTKALNGYLGIVQNIAPADAVETLLAVQMAAVHGATMRMASNLAEAQRPDVVESLERSLNRCARTFAAQVEALKRYRSKGDQRVTVEHVHVHAGGQAVVGNLNQGNGANGRGGVHLSERAAVLSEIEADEMQVQGAGSDGMERLPLSRGERRSAIRAVK